MAGKVFAEPFFDLRRVDFVVVKPVLVAGVVRRVNVDALDTSFAFRRE